MKIADQTQIAQNLHHLVSTARKPPANWDFCPSSTYLALQEQVQVHALISGQPVRRGPAYQIPRFLQSDLPLEPAAMARKSRRTTPHSERTLDEACGTSVREPSTSQMKSGWRDLQRQRAERSDSQAPWEVSATPTTGQVSGERSEAGNAARCHLLLCSSLLSTPRPSFSEESGSDLLLDRDFRLDSTSLLTR